jgi:hypothetical protein
MPSCPGREIVVAPVAATSIAIDGTGGAASASAVTRFAVPYTIDSVVPDDDSGPGATPAVSIAARRLGRVGVSA